MADPMEVVREALTKAKRQHPFGVVSGCESYGGCRCSCGATAVNAEIDAALAALSQLEAGVPEWACAECGSCDGFTPVIHDSIDGREYDMQCAECGSYEVEESPREALHRMARFAAKAEARGIERAAQICDVRGGDVGRALAQAIRALLPAPAAGNGGMT